ncbi:MAG: caspase family protein [Bacteroidia bacterium]
MKILIFTLVFFTYSPLFAGVGPGSASGSAIAEGDLYLITIGIDDYSKSRIATKFGACESDAHLMNNKISKDYMQSYPRIGNEHGQLKNYTLINEAASFEMIKEVFKQVALNAKAEDNFIFYFAGYSVQNYLVPYYELSDSVNPFNIFEHELDSSMIDSQWIDLNQLASWMENIQAKNQLIISEAGQGKEFAFNLISSLFEDNALLASENERNRLIVTTNSLGIEGRYCSSSNTAGALARFISMSSSILMAFENKDRFENELLRIEFNCADFFKSTTYTAIYDESEYRRILVEHQFTKMYRNVIAEDLEPLEHVKDSNQYVPKNYALIISTTNYRNGRPSWTDLTNPERDADTVAHLLGGKYGFDTIRLHNKTSNEIIDAIISLKHQIREEDKVLVFIAGHGHYDMNWDDAYLVFTDAVAVRKDHNYKTYLAVSQMRNLLNSFSSNHVFVILDVCFGGKFEITEKDLPLRNYSELQRDMPLKDWITQKDTSYSSRVFLASGISEVPDYWSNSLYHSPFANKLIYALKKENDFFSPGKLFLYTEGNITRPVLKQFGRHDSHGDFLIPVVQKP